MNRPRIAFFTPLNPQRSGIADYSEELLPHLGELADVDVVIAPYRAAPRVEPGAARIIQVPEFLERRTSYSAVFYQVGNHFRHHAYMLPCMSVSPGILVLHDYCLQYLMLGATLLQGNFDALVNALQPAHGPRARRLAWRLLLGLTDPNRLSFAWPLIERNTAVLVHSAYVRRLVEQDFPDRPVRVIPMGVPLEPAPAAGTRARYGISEDDFILASISTISHTKRLDLILQALPGVLARVPAAKFVVLGGGRLGARARSIIAEYGLHDAVVQLNWVSGEEYRELIALSDIVIDVRYPSGGETSASLARAMAAGKPAILSAQGSFLEVSDDYAIKIPVGGDEVTSLRVAILELATDADRRLRMGQAAREYAKTTLRLDRAARLYVEAALDRCGFFAVPTMDVFFTTPRSRFRRLLISSTYKFCRLAYLYRHYGFKDTLVRLLEEMGAHGERTTGAFVPTR